MEEKFKYRWFAIGDLNGLLGLMFDNLTVLSYLAGIMIFVFEYPAEIILAAMLWNAFIAQTINRQ